MESMLFEFRADFFCAEDKELRYGHEMGGVIVADSFMEAACCLSSQVASKGETIKLHYLAWVSLDDPSIEGAPVLYANHYKR